jgi:hypothetical protein
MDGLHITGSGGAGHGIHITGGVSGMSGYGIDMLGECTQYGGGCFDCPCKSNKEALGVYCTKEEKDFAAVYRKILSKAW